MVEGLEFPLADPRGPIIVDAHLRSNFFHFHAVFGKNLAKNKIFTPNSGVGAPSEKSWILHLTSTPLSACNTLRHKLERQIYDFLGRAINREGHTSPLFT